MFENKAYRGSCFVVLYSYHRECYYANICMRNSVLQLASHSCISCISVENSLELLQLENSMSPIEKLFGFPSRSGMIIESDKKR